MGCLRGVEPRLIEQVPDPACHQSVPGPLLASGDLQSNRSEALIVVIYVRPDELLNEF